jgi:serine/threonine protein kinase
MSPEQVNGNEVDFKSDLYSLGCLFHELLTGAPPYDSERALAVMYQQVNDPPPPLPAILPCGERASAGAVALHAALLAKDRRARPASTQSVADAFAALAEGRTTTFEAKATLGPGVHHLVTSEPIASRPKTVRNLAVLSGAALAVVAASSMWPASSQPLPPAPSAVKPSRVQLMLDTEPLGAQVSIDGRPEGTTPKQLELPADGDTKTILFEKAGYLAVEQRVVTDTSRAIKVVLKPSEPEPKPEAPRSKPQRKIKTTR